MRFATWSGLFSVGVAGAVIVHHQPAVEAGDDVAAMFKAQCMGCHVVPDPAFASDRAYITQIHDTA